MDCYFQKRKPNFMLARENAYKLLLAQECPHLGMSMEKIVVPGKTIIFDTMQNYCKITNSKIEDLTAEGKLKFGCNLNIGSGLAYLILYNDEINNRNCECWTKGHEIGHICMEHTDDDSAEEVETNFFVSCLAMPDVIIKYFVQCGYTVDMDFLMQYFNVSAQAAIKKIKTLNKYFPTTKYDDKLINLFWQDILGIMNEIDSDIQLCYTY